MTANCWWEKFRHFIQRLFIFMMLILTFKVFFEYIILINDKKGNKLKHTFPSYLARRKFTTSCANIEGKIYHCEGSVKAIATSEGVIKMMKILNKYLFQIKRFKRPFSNFYVSVILWFCKLVIINEGSLSVPSPLKFFCWI